MGIVADWRGHERLAYGRGAHYVVGVDEAGRGPLAGPVVAAACHIPLNVNIAGVNDSKKLTPLRRERLFSEITACPEIDYCVAVVDAGVIDEINILQATYRAMREALQGLKRKPDVALIDGADL
ncbi:MAG: ribonuclease HII, partial [Chlamydiia bacterium]|nr:ribonuclease HII [Chlamydiia bacterium]